MDQATENGYKKFCADLAADEALIKASSATPPSEDRGASQLVGSDAVVGERRWSAKFLFAWYDLWVGIFWDAGKRKLYILPLPCVGVVIKFPALPNGSGEARAKRVASDALFEEPAEKTPDNSKSQKSAK